MTTDKDTMRDHPMKETAQRSVPSWFVALDGGLSSACADADARPLQGHKVEHLAGGGRPGR